MRVEHLEAVPDESEARLVTAYRTMSDPHGLIEPDGTVIGATLDAADPADVEILIRNLRAVGATDFADAVDSLTSPDAVEGRRQ